MESSFVLIIAGVVIIMLLFTIRVMLTMANISARRDVGYIQSPNPYPTNGGFGGEWVMILLVAALGVFGYSWANNSAKTSDDKENSQVEQVAQMGVYKNWQEEKAVHINEAPVLLQEEQEQEEKVLYPDAPSFYCIQIQAGEVKIWVDEEVKKLSSKYDDVHVIEVEEDKPFKIVIGHFADKFTAEQMKEKLGLKGSFVREVKMN